MTAQRLLAAVLLVGVLASLVVLGTGGGVAATDDCTGTVQSDLCIQTFDVQDQSLVVGDATSFSVTVHNPGTETATGVVLLHTAGPDGETNAYQMNRLTLEPNASRTLTRDINATTPGEHALQISVIDPTTSERVALSERRQVTIHAEPPARLGGPIDRTELAVAALVGSLAGMAVLGYRHLT